MKRTSRGSRPRVALVATRCYPDLGGIESHVEELVTRLDRGRWQLEVIVTDTTGTLARSDDRGGVPVIRHAAYPRRRDWYVSPSLFWDVVRGRRDLLHIHGVNALVPPVAMLAAILSRTPFIVTLHSGGAHSEFRRRVRAMQWRIVGLLLRRAKSIIAVSRSERETFANVVHSREIHVIRNGSLEIEAPSDVVHDRDLVLSIGRLERYKGHHLAIAALAELLSTRPSARLKILGTGPYGAELRKIANASGVGDHVEISSIPPSDRAEMGRVMAGAGVVTLLSDYEAHPVVVMEALSLGQRVVARANSGLVELIEDGVIMGVPDDASPARIAEALDLAMRGSGAERVVELPTWSQCVTAVEAVYAEVLAV